MSFEPGRILCAQPGSLAVLRGNLSPDGCVIKPAAAESHLLQHTGPAAVFRNYPDLKARIDDPALKLTKDHVIVLQNAGPLGAPGIPEWACCSFLKYLLQEGVRDMVRISDARMSGTSYVPVCCIFLRNRTSEDRLRWWKTAT